MFEALVILLGLGLTHFSSDPPMSGDGGLPEAYESLCQAPWDSRATERVDLGIETGREWFFRATCYDPGIIYFLELEGERWRVMPRVDWTDPGEARRVIAAWNDAGRRTGLSFKTAGDFERFVEAFLAGTSSSSIVYLQDRATAGLVLQLPFEDNELALRDPLFPAADDPIVRVFGEEGRWSCEFYAWNWGIWGRVHHVVVSIVEGARLSISTHDYLGEQPGAAEWRAGFPDSVSVDLEFDDSLEFRAAIEAPASGAGAAIDLRWTFGPIAPWGARIFVRDHDGQEVLCLGNEGKGYSSNQRSSTLRQNLPTREVTLGPGEIHQTGWYRLDGLLGGFPDCMMPSWDPDRLGSYRIQFRVGIDGTQVVGTSEWREFEADLLRRIK